ncbi:MAG: dTDP-glucose 4,6-dehydratase [Ignavibacteriae bacterium]|nr:dTDP-glucose 4,6-dehydratase [Ignavibacteriota bacterium]
MEPSPSYSPENVLITGGAGFIGSAFVRTVLEGSLFSGRIVVVDKLTYAGNLENLADLKGQFDFVQADICDQDAMQRVFETYPIDTVVHFAAESHVDRSILGPLVFTHTNVLGTQILLEAAKRAGVGRFLHVSTDEVYGSLGPEGAFTESSPIDPTSPYAASKAASDLIVLGYAKTFGFPAIVTRCSNNYGPRQFPEKLIPLMIINALRDLRLPVYGDGLNVRDWIHTRDHVSALLAVLRHGAPGEVYNIGGRNEQKNIDIVRAVLAALGKPESLIEFVRDRPAHDRRYAIDPSKIAAELGWVPRVDFSTGIRETIDWYASNTEWWTRVLNGAYMEYYNTQYFSK